MPSGTVAKNRGVFRVQATRIPNPLQELKTTTEWQDTITAQLRKVGNDNPSAADLDNPLEEITKRAIADVLRARHAKHAEELPHAKWREPGGGTEEFLIDNVDLRNFYGSTIGKIAQSHWLPVTVLEGVSSQSAAPALTNPEMVPERGSKCVRIEVRNS
jgi:hypothetical protein